MWKILSPEKSLAVSINCSAKGELSYTVEKKGSIAGFGRLGILTDLGDFTEGLTFTEKSQSEIDESYSLPAGKKAVYVNKAHEEKISFVKDELPFTVVVRAYDNGAAFRYEIPESSKGNNIEVYREVTDFCFPESFDTLWLQEWVASYEASYDKSKWDVTNEGHHYGMPSLLHSQQDNLWVMINEANVLNADGSYCISHLLGTQERRLSLEFAPEAKGMPIKSTLPFQSPWRYLLVEENLDAVVNSTLNYNLNPPSIIEDTSWIRPVRALWSWWSSDQGAQIFTEAKQYVDYAAAVGFEAVVLDAGWDVTWIKEFCVYAHERGISPWLWTAMQSIDTYEKASHYLPLWKSWGIDGVKIDFFENDSAYTASQYQMMAEIMKEEKLMINFHGSTKPMGEGRTWPHFVTAEGIMGMEYYKWSDDKPNAEHNCTVPFIRNAAGPMDYTPTGFINENRNTSMAHQMALPAVFESGCTHYSASIFHLEPWKGTDFLRRLKPKYDGVKLLSGYPGEYVTMLRWTEKTEEYIIGCICNAGRIHRLYFDFLPDGDFEAEIYGDNRFGDAIICEKRTVNRDSFIDLTMPEHGGAGLYITREIAPLAPVNSQGYMTQPIAVQSASEMKGFGGSEYFGEDEVMILRSGAYLVAEDIPETKDYTIRVCYCTHESFVLQISDGMTSAAEKRLLISGPGMVFAMTDITVPLKKGSCKLILRNLSGGEPLISAISVIDNNPASVIHIPVETGVMSGGGMVVDNPLGGCKTLAMTAGSKLEFKDVIVPCDGEYILRINYSADVTGMATVEINGAETVDAKLSGIGMWSKTKEGDILAREVLVKLKKGKNSLTLRANSALPPVLSIEIIEK